MTLINRFYKKTLEISTKYYLNNTLLSRKKKQHSWILQHYTQYNIYTLSQNNYKIYKGSKLE